VVLPLPGRSPQVIEVAGHSHHAAHGPSADNRGLAQPPRSGFVVAVRPASGRAPRTQILDSNRSAHAAFIHQKSSACGSPAEPFSTALQCHFTPKDSVVLLYLPTLVRTAGIDFMVVLIAISRTVWPVRGRNSTPPAPAPPARCWQALIAHRPLSILCLTAPNPRRHTFKRPSRAGDRSGCPY